MREVPADLTRLIALVTRAQDRQITPDARFEALGNWSSLTALRLLTMIEQQWGIALDLREYFAIETVGGLADAIAGARSAGPRT
jgi:acyl carrier protein